MNDSSSPYRFDVDVSSDGRIELQLPLPAGAHVTVYVLERPAAEFEELVSASLTSMDFWDCVEDDEDWNHA